MEGGIPLNQKVNAFAMKYLDLYRNPQTTNIQLKEIFAKGVNTTMSKKLSTEEVLRLNQRRINKVLRQNGVDPNTVPPLEGTYEERSQKKDTRGFSKQPKAY